MQRVVRLSFAGLLAVAGAGLSACGDKVNLPAPVNPAVDSVVHSVTVSPAQASVGVGSSIQLAVSVDAGAGVTNRTVTWSSSDATIATVGATDGKVTGVKAGNATIIAKSAKDPSVSGAAAITVTGGGVPTVTISSINTTNAFGNSVPADLTNANRQLDLTLNVEANGQIIKTVTATITCGAKSKSASQNISAPASVGAEESAVPITLSINTATFNSTTGAPDLTNGSCTLSAVATTGTGSQTATNNTSLTLNNADVAIVTTTNSGSTANDANGQPWKSGNITVSALPVLYSGRTPATVSITLPGATGTPTQTVAAAATGATTATWSATATTGARITQQTLPGPADAVTGLPLGVHPVITMIDTQGANLNLVQANPTSQSDVRIDNQSPNAPTTANLSAAAIANSNWVTGSYTFTGTGKYVSGGDNSGVGSTTTAIWYAPAGTGAPTPLPVVGTTLTAITAANCPTTGFTLITSAADIPNSTLLTSNTAYTIRALETDKLGNVRCTDYNAAAVLTKFGVDKNAPVASVTAGPTNLSAGATLASLANAGNFTVAFQDSLSGFSATPFLVTTTRFDAAAAATCVIGVIPAGGGCTPAAQAAGSVPANGGSAADGYYTTRIQVADLAGNITDLGSTQVLVDNTAPAAVAGVSIPANITANSAQTFSSGFTDNLDLISGEGSIVYPNMTLFYSGAMSPAGVTFDNVLTLSGTSTVTIPAFIIDMQQVDAGGAPTAAGAKPTSVNVRGLDGAKNFGTNNAVIQPANVATATATEFTVANFSTFAISNPSVAGNIKNGTTSANPTTPTSVVLAAAATGVVATTNNPFVQVCFYYQNTTAGSSFGEWVQIGCQGAAAVTDVGGVRTWTYGAVTFDPPASLGTAAVLQIRAVGMNVTGNAISTLTNTNLTLVP